MVYNNNAEYNYYYINNNFTLTTGGSVGCTAASHPQGWGLYPVLPRTGSRRCPSDRSSQGFLCRCCNLIGSRSHITHHVSASHNQKRAPDAGPGQKAATWSSQAPRWHCHHMRLLTHLQRGSTLRTLRGDNSYNKERMSVSFVLHTDRPLEPQTQAESSFVFLMNYLLGCLRFPPFLFTLSPYSAGLPNENVYCIVFICSSAISSLLLFALLTACTLINTECHEKPRKDLVAVY